MKLILKRSLIIFSIICILFLSLSIIYASDDINDSNDINYISDNGDILNGSGYEVLLDAKGYDLNGDMNDLNHKDNSNIIRSSSSSTFEDIQSLVDKTKENGVVELSGLYIGNGNLIKINKTLTIKGKSNATLDARHLSEIMNISASNVVLENICFINSYDMSVYVKGNNILIDNCFFNNSINGELGSALSCKGNNITISNSNFTNNIANKSVCHHTNGPAIYMLGKDCRVLNCYFYNNSGYNYETASSGGAIFWVGDDGLVANSTFLNNSATAKFNWTYAGDEQSYLADGEGGAIWWCGNRGRIINCSFIDGIVHSNGGAIYFQASANSSIINSSFINNYAVGEGGVLFLGLNIFNLSIKNCKFINNTSTGWKSVSRNYGPYGSAIYSTVAVNDTYVDSCIFSNNNKYPIYNLGNNLIINNSIFENKLPDSSDSSNQLSDSSNLSFDSLNQSSYSENIIYSYTDCILENNFWGTNYYSFDELIDKKIICINKTYRSPDNWFNLDINGLDLLEDKGDYIYRLQFISNEGSIIESLPIYNLIAKNNVYENSFDDSNILLDDGADLIYKYNRASMDRISVYNNLGDLIVSKEIYGGIVIVNDSSDATRSIQEAIDNANPGDIILLDSLCFENVSNINITKNINILGRENATISSDGTNQIFSILPKSKGGPDSVNISNIIFKIKNGDIIVLASADNDSNPLRIDVSSIDFRDNYLDSDNENVVPESVTILQLDSYRQILSPTGEIRISNNSIVAGVNPFKFSLKGFVYQDDVLIVPQNISFEKKASLIEYHDMETVAVDTVTDGRVGEYFKVVLKDAEGSVLSGKAVQIGFNGKIYNRTTDENGSCKLQINLPRVDTYTFAVSYLGDDEYNGSFCVAKITVNAQKGSLTVPNKSYAASAKTKSLTATFKSGSGKLVKGKKLSIIVNGKTYAAKTNDKGIATVNVSLNKKGTYNFTVKFAGDNTYSAISKTGKLTIR